MSISKWNACIILILITTLPFVIARVYWLRSSIKTQAVVTSVEETLLIRPVQTYPVFQYRTKNYMVRSSGNYNLPYLAGDTVSIRYNPKDEWTFRIDNNW